jgi:hypothetical protein
MFDHRQYRGYLRPSSASQHATSLIRFSESGQRSAFPSMYKAHDIVIQESRFPVQRLMSEGALYLTRNIRRLRTRLFTSHRPLIYSTDTCSRKPQLQTRRQRTERLCLCSSISSSKSLPSLCLYFFPLPVPISSSTTLDHFNAHHEPNWLRTRQ